MKVILELLKPGSQESSILGTGIVTINSDADMVDVPASFALDNHQSLCSFILQMRLSFHFNVSQL